MVTQLTAMTLGVVDTMMVGRLGGGALAAVGVASLFVLSTGMIGIGIMQVLVPMSAQAWGAGDQAAFGLLLRRGLILSQLVALPYVVLYQFAGPILLHLGEPPEASRIAGEFVRALVPGWPAFMAFMAIRGVLQGRGVVRPALIAVVVGNLVNAAGNYAFIYGRWGAPALGVPGSAWSTSATRFVMLAVMIVLCAPFVRESWRASAGQPLFVRAAFGRLLRVGIPIGAQMGIESWAFQLCALFIGWTGAGALAAHQVTMQLSILTVMVSNAIGQAASTRVGIMIGAQDREGTRRAAIAPLWLAAVVMTIFSTVFLLVPESLVHVFTHDPDVEARALPLLMIAGVFQVVDGLEAVATGILRGASDTTAAAVATLVGFWILGLPLGAALMFGAHLGATGMWLGITLALTATAALLIWRVFQRFVVR